MGQHRSAEYIERLRLWLRTVAVVACLDADACKVEVKHGVVTASHHLVLHLSWRGRPVMSVVVAVRGVRLVVHPLDPALPIEEQDAVGELLGDARRAVGPQHPGAHGDVHLRRSRCSGHRLHSGVGVAASSCAVQVDVHEVVLRGEEQLRAVRRGVGYVVHERRHVSRRDGVGAGLRLRPAGSRSRQLNYRDARGVVRPLLPAQRVRGEWGCRGW